ncbi:MAG TPA: carboxylesterase family protein [Bacteroidales bacterium]|nr:carboxylesterase family protein [Bacteroidales bacterium]
MKKLASIFLVCIMTIIFCFSCSSGGQTQKPTVKTTSGKISGSIEDGIFTFKGIPYAKAERFMPPQAPDSWKGILECTKFSPVAMQGNGSASDSTMDEKKLFTVNVWTQGLDDGKKRPVMLWIHGGGFASGSSNDPVTYGTMLAKKGDIVLVSVNHRLNILGFLDLSEYGEKYASSANVGMLDLVASLEWINKNIEEFGGDPGNVTIFGESGGGGKVATLLCMPAAKGLFHKAIIQSGTLLNIMDKEKSTRITRALMDILGLTADQVTRLDTIPYRKLVQTGNQALARTVGMRTPGTAKMFGFGPVPDGVNLLQQPFSPDFADISKDVPVMIGTTFNELRRTAYAEKNLTMEQAVERIKKSYGEKADKYIELFGKSYPGYSPQDLLSIDTVFRPYTIMVANAWSRKSAAPVYAYMLTWKSPVEDSTRGSFHGLDIALAFNNIDLGQKQWTGNGEDAYALAEKMSSAWLHFAKTGNPNVENVLPQWRPYSRENGETMIFDRECRTVNNHDRELMYLIKPVD